MKDNSVRPIVIAFAHDDRRYSDIVLEKLSEDQGLNPEFEIIDLKSAQEVLNFLETSPAQMPDILFMDGRIRHGGAFTDKETANDFYSGRKLYRKTRRMYNQLPICLFTTDYHDFIFLSEWEKRDPNFKLFSVGLDLPDQILKVLVDFFL